jgi:hypothetical protein
LRTCSLGRALASRSPAKAERALSNTARARALVVAELRFGKHALSAQHHVPGTGRHGHLCHGAGALGVPVIKLEIKVAAAEPRVSLLSAAAVHRAPCAPLLVDLPGRGRGARPPLHDGPRAVDRLVVGDAGERGAEDGACTLDAAAVVVHEPGVLDSAEGPAGIDGVQELEGALPLGHGRRIARLVFRRRRQEKAGCDPHTQNPSFLQIDTHQSLDLRR